MSNSHRRNSRTWMSAILISCLAFTLMACGAREPEVTPASAATRPAEPTSNPGGGQETETVEDHLEAAAAHYADGDYDKAITELEKAIALEPDNVDAHTNLALSYFADGDYEGAAAAWTEVIRLEPGEAEVYYERGMSYFNLKQYDPAIADLTQAITLDDANADAFRVRGKAHAFLEDYEDAIADFTQAIDLDPAADEAYFNRAVALTQIGGEGDLPAIIADYGRVMQLSENAELREQAKATLETFLKNSNDPVLRQQASDALEAKVTPAGEPATVDPVWAGIDANRAPGHSIGFQQRLGPGAAHRFLFLASPGDTVGAGISSSADLRIGIQDTQSGQVLAVVPSNNTSMLVNVPTNSLYHVVIEDAGGKGGDYTAAFEASAKVSFALDPGYFIVGRLPQGGLLTYTFTASGGATLQGNVIPHPGTAVDLVVKVMTLETQAVQAEYNATGTGQNEQFSFTIPNSGDGKALTYIVSVEDASKNSGAYILAVASDAPSTTGSANPPEAIVQIIFDAAASGNTAPLAGLCDPRGENDEDTQMICDVATDDANREAFIEYFAGGKVNGETRISPGGDMAEVPVLVGPVGDQEEETIELIQRDGQWYLFGF